MRREILKDMSLEHSAKDGFYDKELDMELKKNWADKVIEEAEGMDSIERSKYVRKKLEELVERIALLDCLEQTEDVKNTIRIAERLFDQLFEYVNA